MTHILMLLSSPRGANSLSTKVASALADELTSHPGATLHIRDLAAEVLPPITPAYVVGRMLPPEQRMVAQTEAVALAEMLVDELNAADVVVIAASMINFGPSSTLKTWIDYVVWPGRTMVQTPEGPKGLITGKKVYLAVASGGIYSNGPMAANDMLVPYLKMILGFIGITDIETIRAEAQSFGPEQAAKGAAVAMEQVVALAKSACAGALSQMNTSRPTMDTRNWIPK